MNTFGIKKLKVSSSPLSYKLEAFESLLLILEDVSLAQNHCTGLGVCQKCKIECEDKEFLLMPYHQNLLCQMRMAKEGYVEIIN